MTGCSPQWLCEVFELLYWLLIPLVTFCFGIAIGDYVGEQHAYKTMRRKRSRAAKKAALKRRKDVEELEALCGK